MSATGLCNPQPCGGRLRVSALQSRLGCDAIFNRTPNCNFLLRNLGVSHVRAPAGGGTGNRPGRRTVYTRVRASRDREDQRQEDRQGEKRTHPAAAKNEGLRAKMGGLQKGKGTSRAAPSTENS